MDTQARNELASIKRELSSIISELESISAGVKKNFVGIGGDKCSASINKVVNNYYTVQRKLNNMDTSTVNESYAQAHSGGTK